MELRNYSEDNILKIFIHESKMIKHLESHCRKNASIEHALCWILISSPFSISTITSSNIAQFLKSWAADRKGCWKMSKMEILRGLPADKLPNKKRQEFFGTPCSKRDLSSSNLFSLSSGKEQILAILSANENGILSIMWRVTWTC